MTGGFFLRFSATATADRVLPERLAGRARPLLARVDDVLAGRGAGGTAGRMSLIAFVVRVLSALIAFASQVLLARWMVSFEYGIFVLVWTAIVIVGVLASFGFNTSVVRFIPQFIHTGRTAELRGIIHASRMFVLAASSVIAAAGVALVWALAGHVEDYYLVPFVVAFICVPIIALSSVLEGIARAHDWGLMAMVPVFIARPLLILVIMLGVILAGFEPSAVNAVLAALIATFLTTVYQLAAIPGSAERRAEPGPRTIELGLWIAISLPIFLGEGFFFLLSNVDVLMVGWFLDPHDVAVYFAAVKTLALVHFVYFAIKAGAAQRYAQYAHGGEREKLAGFARQTAVWTFWPSLAVGLMVLAVGRPLLMLFGPGFEAGYPLLFVLVVGVVARASVGPAESLLVMTGHQVACALVFGATLGVAILLNALLIPLYGLWGAAFATMGAMLFEATAASLVIRRKLGFVMFVFWPRAKETA